MDDDDLRTLVRLLPVEQVTWILAPERTSEEMSYVHTYASSAHVLSLKDLDPHADREEVATVLEATRSLPFYLNDDPSIYVSNLPLLSPSFSAVEELNAADEQAWLYALHNVNFLFQVAGSWGGHGKWDTWWAHEQLHSMAEWITCSLQSDALNVRTVDTAFLQATRGLPLEDDQRMAINLMWMKRSMSDRSGIFMTVRRTLTRLSRPMTAQEPTIASTLHVAMFLKQQPGLQELRHLFERLEEAHDRSATDEDTRPDSVDL